MSQDQDQRRAYWASQMDEAHRFMEMMKRYPVQECGEPFVSLPESAKEAGVEVAFSTVPHVMGLPRVYTLRSGQIPSFISAAREMNRRGWVMRVEDGFRNRTMQKFVGRQPHVFDAILRSVVWELGGRTPEVEFVFKRMSVLVAMFPKVGTHMSGSAIDISVLDRKTGQEIDRGKPYLEMSELTPMTSPFISDDARRNRAAITDVMRANGFTEYPWEFWHYNGDDCYAHHLRQTGKPARYGAVDWDPVTGKVTPIPNPTDPLSSLDEIREDIRAALARFAKN